MCKAYRPKNNINERWKKCTAKSNKPTRVVKYIRRHSGDAKINLPSRSEWETHFYPCVCTSTLCVSPLRYRAWASVQARQGLTKNPWASVVCAERQPRSWHFCLAASPGLVPVYVLIHHLNGKHHPHLGVVDGRLCVRYRAEGCVCGPCLSMSLSLSVSLSIALMRRKRTVTTAPVCASLSKFEFECVLSILLNQTEEINKKNIAYAQQEIEWTHTAH